MTKNLETSELVTLTCEICGKQYQMNHDPKKVTPTNAIPVLFYCCSLECERESWERIDWSKK